MKKFWKILGIIILLFIAACVFFYFRAPATKNPQWGLTFSYQYAQSLGFDWKTEYLDILADLKPKNLRLMTYWEDMEPQQGQYNFTIVDQEVQEAQKQGINVILVVGRKQPRWPECHEPSWYNNLSPDAQNQAITDFITATVNHYKSYSAIKDWQVENEPYFGYGVDCPTSQPSQLKAEVATVKSLDSRPIVLTDSGELGAWVPAADAGADIFGATMYRVAYDPKYGGYFKYPLPPFYYRIKAGIVKTFSHNTNQVIDVELQEEPWLQAGLFNTPLSDQDAQMNPKVFEQNINYAKGTGLSAHYLWGVEWWYWMAKKNNDWGMWNAAKNLFNS